RPFSLCVFAGKQTFPQKALSNSREPKATVVQRHDLSIAPRFERSHLALTRLHLNANGFLFGVRRRYDIDVTVPNAKRVLNNDGGSGEQEPVASPPPR